MDGTLKTRQRTNSVKMSAHHCIEEFVCIVLLIVDVFLRHHRFDSVAIACSAQRVRVHVSTEERTEIEAP